MLLRISFSQQHKRSQGAAKMHRLKPERDGLAALLAFIAALDASARPLRRNGCGDYTINGKRGASTSMAPATSWPSRPASRHGVGGSLKKLNEAPWLSVNCLVTDLLHCGYVMDVVRSRFCGFRSASELVRASLVLFKPAAALRSTMPPRLCLPPNPTQLRHPTAPLAGVG